MDKEYKYLFKLIMIGNSSAGKSSILHYYTEGKQKKTTSQTIGVEFCSKVIQQQNYNIKLQIWDTAGQERFKSVARTYYRGSIGAIIVYDITSQSSYNSLENWIKDAKELAQNQLCIIVVGNKSDLYQQRMVDKIEANKFCQSKGVLYLETSAVNGENICEVFKILIKDILNKIDMGSIFIIQGLYEDNEISPPLLLDRVYQLNSDQKKEKKCCSYIM